jgi:hypothetical protein
MLPVKVQIKFTKTLLGVNKQAVNLAVLGEIGMYPISIHAFKSAIEYWLHILKSEDILLYKAYETINRSLPDSFATRIKILLNKLHFSHVWDNQSTFSNKRFLHAIYKQLTENFNMLWKTRIFYDSLTANGNKLRTYRNSKEKYETDNYLFLDIDKTLIKQFTHIKISNSKPMIELGRHNKTDINNRMCPLCKNGVEDEYHFIILCSSLNNIRNKMFANILSIFPSFRVLTDEKKFLYLFRCEEYDIVEVIVRGVNEMYNRRNELIGK